MYGIEILQIGLALFIAVIVIFAVFRMVKTDFGKVHK